MRAFLLSAAATLLILGAATGCAVQVGGDDGAPDEELAAEGSALLHGQYRFMSPPPLNSECTVVGPTSCFPTDTQLDDGLADPLLLTAKDKPGAGDNGEPDPTPWAHDNGDTEQEDQEEPGGEDTSSNGDQEGEPDPTPWANSASQAPSSSANGKEGDGDDPVTFSEPDPTPWQRPWWHD